MLVNQLILILSHMSFVNFYVMLTIAVLSLLNN